MRGERLMPDHEPVCLTAAGSDPSGGAGLQADLKPLAEGGVFGTAAVAAPTAQKSRGVQGVRAVDPAFVGLQVESLFADRPVVAAKTGMLANAATIAAVADAFESHPDCLLVVDPVMVA